MPNAIAPNITENDSNSVGVLNISLTMGAILSAKNIFLKNPMAIRDIPNLRAESWIVILRNLDEMLSLTSFSLN